MSAPARGTPTERPPVIMRPNGKPYRPRRIAAHCWDNEDNRPGSGCGAIVLGTHDIDRARPLAEEACNAWFGTQYAINPELGWFRSSYADGRPTWIQDEVHGSAGVLFTASDDFDMHDDGHASG